MKKVTILLILILSALTLQAQSMQGYYYNEEYQIYLKLSLDSANITVPDQDIYGELAGYLGSKRDSRLWLITEARRTGDNRAEVTVINDYGSEDFEATLTETADGTLTMKHRGGSTYKIVVNNKYVKIPKEITLKKKNNKP